MTSDPDTPDATDSEDAGPELRIPAHGDILGSWLMSVLNGKITYTEKSVKTGEEYEPGDTPVPGTYQLIPHGESLGGCMGQGHGCVWQIQLRWDQWAECQIRCNHKDYQGVSRYFNLTEAVIDAIGAFNEDDHPQGKPGRGPDGNHDDQRA
jgi:hypothetical protein